MRRAVTLAVIALSLPALAACGSVREAVVGPRMGPMAYPSVLVGQAQPVLASARTGGLGCGQMQQIRLFRGNNECRGPIWGSRDQERDNGWCIRSRTRLRPCLRAPHRAATQHRLPSSA